MSQTLWPAPTWPPWRGARLGSHAAVFCARRQNQDGRGFLSEQRPRPPCASASPLAGLGSRRKQFRNAPGGPREGGRSPPLEPPMRCSRRRLSRSRGGTAELGLARASETQARTPARPPRRPARSLHPLHSPSGSGSPAPSGTATGGPMDPRLGLQGLRRAFELHEVSNHCKHFKNKQT